MFRAPDSMPFRQMGSGVRLLAEVRQHGYVAKKAVILVTVKAPVIVELGLPAVQIFATTVCLLTPGGRILLYVQVRTPEGMICRMAPNARHRCFAEDAMDIEVLRGRFAEIIGYDTLVIGWNLDADLAAIGVCVPAIQCFDLATDGALRQIVFSLRKGITGVTPGTDACSLILPETVLALTNNNVNIRMTEARQQIREAHVDGVFIAALWDRLGKVLVGWRQDHCSISMFAMAQSYVGAGELCERLGESDWGRKHYAGYLESTGDEGTRFPVRRGIRLFGGSVPAKDLYKAGTSFAAIEAMALLEWTPIPIAKGLGKYFFTQQLVHLQPHLRYFKRCVEELTRRDLRLEAPTWTVNSGEFFRSYYSRF
jgi:hypothetical protein